MVAVPISQSFTQVPAAGSASFPAPSSASSSPDWTHYIAAATLVAGGVLMVTGHKRAGMAVAAAGTALALVEESSRLSQRRAGVSGQGRMLFAGSDHSGRADTGYPATLEDLQNRV